MYAGLAKADGLVRLEGNTLVLEFQIQDRALGVLKSELRELRIPIFEIEHLELANGLLRKPRLIVQTETMRVSRQIPGSEHGTFSLTLENAHRLAARHLIETVEVAKARERALLDGPCGLE